MTQSVDATDLVARARQVMTLAYAPYSQLKVGVALLTDRGDVIAGCNVENASYGLTMCAERAAVGTAVSRGSRSFVAIAIVSSRAGPCTPCGACRQVLAEFSDDLEVILERPDGTTWHLPLGGLLPHHFSLNSAHETGAIRQSELGGHPPRA